MRTSLLSRLACPRCHSAFTLRASLLGTGRSGIEEIRTGRLRCAKLHEFRIEDGIVRFGVGLGAPEVVAELRYENTTWHGDGRLDSPAFLAALPEGGTPVWPHTAHFGPDFDGLIQRLGIGPGACVLDIGTATCWSSRKLAQAGAEVVALDINTSPSYGLGSAEVQFAHHGVYFDRVLESMTELPFTDGSFDFVTFNAALHHTPDLERTLAQCRRVLRPGGKLGMVSEELVSLRHRFDPPDDHTEEGSHHEISHAELGRVAREAGFRVRYHLAAHHERSLARRLAHLGSAGERLASLAAGALERLPPLLWQLNSNAIVLSVD